MPDAIAGHGHARVIANGLRELDRFLSLLIDAVAHRIATPRDRAALRLLDNTARKLWCLRRVLALDLPAAIPDDAALRAIGRARDCLFHTAGVVRPGRAGCTPTIGWSAPDTHVVPVAMPVGSRLVVSAADMTRICRFYDRIADDLLAMIAASGPPIDLSDPADYIGRAHVACDGI